MPIIHRWLDQGQDILFVTYRPGTTWDEYYTFFETLRSETDPLNRRMCLIHIVEAIPSGLLLPHIQAIQNQTPDYVLKAVVVPASNVVANSIVTGIITVLSNMGRGKGLLSIAKTREEAIAFAKAALREYHDHTQLPTDTVLLSDNENDPPPKN